MLLQFEEGCESHCSFPQGLLDLLLKLPTVMTFSETSAKVPLTVSFGSASSKALSTPAIADWWVSLAISHSTDQWDVSLWALFQVVHTSVRTILDLFQAPD
jgi:hypothetical protein